MGQDRIRHRSSTVRSVCATRGRVRPRDNPQSAVPMQIHPCPTAPASTHHYRGPTISPNPPYHGPRTHYTTGTLHPTPHHTPLPPPPPSTPHHIPLEQPSSPAMNQPDKTPSKPQRPPLALRRLLDYNNKGLKE